jgi:hypothetical protein
MLAVRVDCDLPGGVRINFIGRRVRGSLCTKYWKMLICGSLLQATTLIYGRRCTLDWGNPVSLVVGVSLLQDKVVQIILYAVKSRS